MTMLDDLLELMPDTVIVQPGTTDFTGDFVAAGAALSLKCYIETESKTIRNEQGNEVVSSSQIYVGSSNSLTTDKHRYTLPTRFSPRLDIKAEAVEHVSDEDGAHHEVVMLL